MNAKTKILLVTISVLLSCKNTSNPQANVEMPEVVPSAKEDTLVESAKINCIDSAKINTDVFCVQVYEPVCGCDGKTYSNSCMASVSGVTDWTEGSCNERK